MICPVPYVLYTALLGRGSEVDWGTPGYLILCLSRGEGDGKGPDLTPLEASETIELELCSDCSLLRAGRTVFKKRASSGQRHTAELGKP